MASIGDYRWEENIENVEIRAEDQSLVTTVDLFIEDVPVGDAAQTTAALGLAYDLLDKTTFYLDYNYFDRYFADFDPSDGGYPNTPGSATRPWEAPSYGV